MSTGLYVFTMLTHFAGYESVHFGLHYAAKNKPTGAAWGLMHFPVMMHYPVMYGIECLNNFIDWSIEAGCSALYIQLSTRRHMILSMLSRNFHS